MKTNILLTIAIVFAAFAAACNTQSNPANGNMQAGMNHNMDMPMNHNSMNSNEMDHSMMQSSPNAASAPYDLQFWTR